MSRVCANLCKMETGRGSYSVFSDEQKQILRQYFDQGMTSSGPNMHAVIEQAAIKVNASVDKVKVSYFELCLIVLANHAVA